MALKLMYITNRPDVAQVAEAAGVDRIFVDMEYIGKGDRQGGMDTVQSHHTPEDIRAIRGVLTTARIMARINPIHEATAAYTSSAEEINAAVEAGADILMLPYFKTPAEVETFVRLVNGRAKTLLLVETPEAAEGIEEILDVGGIDEVFVGLNDLSLGYGKKFMFEMLTDGTVERLCRIFRRRELPYGFGGIAAPGRGMLPAEYIIGEHYRLGSTCAILSRSFCNTALVEDIGEIRAIFESGMREIRAVEAEWDALMAPMWENRRRVCDIVRQIARDKA
jgi:2-keto-3-deoxy-L-rhamnonate aldolase RhmA